MTNEKTLTNETKEIMDCIPILAEWASQWVDEFLNESILPNAKDALYNPLVRYALKEWDKVHKAEERNKNDIELEIKNIVFYDKDVKKHERSVLCNPLIDWSQVLYEIFAKVYKKEEEKGKNESNS